MKAQINQILLTSLPKDDKSAFDIWKYHKHLAQPNNIKSKQSSSSSAAVSSEVTTQMYLGSLIAITQNPINTWEDMKTMFPGLYKYSIKYLPIIATSVPSERLF